MDFLLAENRTCGLVLALVFAFTMLLYANNALAGSCSPGIPCTDYTIAADPTAGTDATLNGPKTGQPAPYTAGSCDGNFMNQIIGQAYLGASRELIMSEQLIHKPDSVLEYTCFDQLVNKTAHQADMIFSGSNDFDNRGFALKAGDDSGSDDQTSNPRRGADYDGSDENDGEIDTAVPPACTQEPCDEYTVNFSDTQLDDRLVQVVMEPLQAYITTNFDHTFLGGAASVDSNMSYSIGSDSYNCSHMQTVWDISQCGDFGEDDRFRTFEHFVGADPRAFPAACSPSYISSDASTQIDSGSPPGLFTYTVNAPCPAAGSTSTANTAINNDQIRLANNCDYTYASFDVMSTQFSIIKSPVISTQPELQDAAKLSLGYPILCSDPLPTGVLVFSYEHSRAATGTMATVQRFVHYDHICPNPGCYYRPIKVPFPLIPGVPIDLLDITSVPSVPSVGLCLPL